MITTHTGQRQKGVVLIVVLWVLALLMILLAAFSTSVRIDRQISSELVQRAQARAGMDAALAYLAAIQKIGGETWTGLKGQVFILPLPSGRVRFRLIPEEAYLSLTGAPEDLLRMLISGLASEQTDLETAIRSLLDRRLPQQTGSAADDTSTPTKQPMHATEELLLLPGFDRPLVERMTPFVTVDSAHTGLAVNFSSPELLGLITGDPRIVAALQSAPEGSMDDAAFNPGFATAPAGRIFRLQVEVGEDQQRRKAEVTVIFGEGSEDYQVVRWNEYNPRFDLD